LILAFRPIVYGLDLQGGSHLLIRIHADEAVENEVDDIFAAVSKGLGEANIELSNSKESVVFDQEILHSSTPYKQLADIENKRPYIEFTLADASKLEIAQEEIRKRVNLGANGNWDMSVTGRTIRLTLRTDAILNIRRTTVDNVRRSISYRIDQLGVAEPNIVIQGDPSRSQRILIQLPGVEDPEEAKRRIKTPGNLEFRLVVYDENGIPYEAATREKLIEKLGGKIPAGTEPVPEYEQTEAEAKGRARVPLRWILLYKEAPVNSSHLVDAEVGRDQTNNVVVRFSLNAEGGDRIRTLSRNNINKLLATVLDDEAIVVANIESELGSESQISGRYTQEEAARLAWLLRTGSVPTSMHFEEERSVGPALGAARSFSEYRACHGLPRLVRRRADAARNRRHHPHYRHGRRCERPHLREDQRGGPPRQADPQLHRKRLQQSLRYDLRREHHNPDRGDLSLPVRNRSDPRLRDDDHDRHSRLHVYRHLCRTRRL